MILDNILRSLNQYMKDMFTTFGGESKEYMTALKTVKENLNDELLEKTARKGLDFEGDAPTEPLQLSRGKEAKNILENFESDLLKIRKDQKDQGTARKQTEKYREDAENRGIDPDSIDIKEEAQALYEFDNSTNDWYDEVMGSPYVTDEEKEEIRDIYSDLFENYEDATFRDMLENRVREILREAEKRKNAAQTDAYISPVDDIGYDPSDDFGGRL